ncbi:hypothetical protein NE619_10590 [Anaerovorax odorimutans]|uniref:Uncharacterized protein n=1 Tax=Anaerovorax odorimutans TaxID=109327 RepID=A0ABT1RPQ7_9FIRM|nr:hypothetical protein [Anaerovorax odorimutans]MCQ4637173.1 hypothetical protein [Anaerovorax odorimutans]
MKMKVLGVILIVFGVLGGVGLLLEGDPDALGGLILIAIGLFLYKRARQRTMTTYTWQEPFQSSAVTDTPTSQKVQDEEDRRKDQELRDLQRRVLQNQYNDQIHEARCPKCGSTSLSAHKKGFGVGKAVVGVSVIGNPIGLILGNFRAKKVRVTCLKCGHQFWAGKRK